MPTSSRLVHALTSPLRAATLVPMGAGWVLGLPVLGAGLMMMGHAAAPLSVPIGLCLGAAVVLALPRRRFEGAVSVGGVGTDADG